MACFLNLHLECPDEQVEKKITWEDINLFQPIRARFIRHLIISFPDVGKNYLAGSSKLFSTCTEEQFEIFFPIVFFTFRFFPVLGRKKYFWRWKCFETLSELHSKRLDEILGRVICETNVVPNKLVKKN